MLESQPIGYQKHRIFAMGRPLWIAALLLFALAIVLPACGSDDDGGSSERRRSSRDSDGPGLSGRLSAITESNGAGSSGRSAAEDDSAGSRRSGLSGSDNPQPASVLDLVREDAWEVGRMDVRRMMDNDYHANEFLFSASGLADALGAHPNDLSEIVIASTSDGEIVVLKGDFNLSNLREGLEDLDGERSSYRGYEVWEDLSGGGTVALLDGYVVGTTSVQAVENTLKNLYNGTGSLERADAQNGMKRILDKLGRGSLIVASGQSSCHIDHCDGYGYVVEVNNAAEEVRIEIALLFSNESAAERAADDYDQVADFIEYEMDVDIEDTKSEGRFVVSVAFEDLDDAGGRSTTVPDYPFAAPAATPTPPSRIIFPTGVPRADWIDHCYDYSPVASMDDCSCVYEYLRNEGVSPVPLWEIDWENGYGVGAEAVDWCY